MQSPLMCLVQLRTTPLLISTSSSTSTGCENRMALLASVLATAGRPVAVAGACGCGVRGRKIDRVNLYARNFIAGFKGVRNKYF